MPKYTLKKIKQNSKRKLKSKTMKRKSRKAIVQRRIKGAKLRRKITQRGGYERLTQDFVDTMKENMWQFMNGDTMQHILNLAGCQIGISYKEDVEDDDFSDERYHNTICIKGPPDEGHYVFVDEDGDVTGTYENDLIDNEFDDGICHGGALTAALRSCGYDVPEFNKYPDTDEEMNENYRIIINTYIMIIEKGWWDSALREYFYYDVEWIVKFNNNRNNDNNRNNNMNGNTNMNENNANKMNVNNNNNSYRPNNNNNNMNRNIEETTTQTSIALETLQNFEIPE
jgi:hypothetical protein